MLPSTRQRRVSNRDRWVRGEAAFRGTGNSESLLDAPGFVSCQRVPATRRKARAVPVRTAGFLDHCGRTPVRRGFRCMANYRTGVGPNLAGRHTAPLLSTQRSGDGGGCSASAGNGEADLAAGATPKRTGGGCRRCASASTRTGCSAPGSTASPRVSTDADRACSSTPGRPCPRFPDGFVESIFSAGRAASGNRRTGRRHRSRSPGCP